MSKEIETPETAYLFMNILEAEQKAAEKSTAEFTANVTKDGLLYALKWGESYAVKAAKGSLAKALLSAIEASTEEPLTLLERVNAARDRCREKLTYKMLNDGWSASSSSAYSNATDTAERKAVSEFISTYL